MKYKDKDGNVYENDTGQDKFLGRVYASVIGRMMIRPFLCPAVSKAAGWFLDKSISKFLVGPFIRNNGIDIKDYLKSEYTSFNDFFTRKILPEKRPVDTEQTHLISPADGKVSVYSLEKEDGFVVKDTVYTLESVLRNVPLAKRYQNGYAVIIRLTVDDYHRYCYPSDGIKSKNYHIPGIFHTVNPSACQAVPVYKENTREYTLIRTNRFKTLLQMEVGALLVGRICNSKETGTVKKGEEKGKFEFGGSTILLLVQEGGAALREDLIKNTKEGFETIVKMGECIGTAMVKV